MNCCAARSRRCFDRYGWIYDATARQWVRFTLWPAQLRALRTINAHLLVIILKARQLGMSLRNSSWGLLEWLMLFQAEATVLLFSKRDDEAVYLLTRPAEGDVRKAAGVDAVGGSPRQ